MKKSKIVAVLIVIVGVMAIGLFVASEARAGEDSYTFKRLARLDYGSGKGQIGLLDLPEIPLTGPESFWVNTQGEIYICDTVNARIEHFSPEGELLSELPVGFNCSDLAVDKEDNLFVLDRQRRLLCQFGRDGKGGAVQPLNKELMEKADMLSFSDEKLVMMSGEQEESEIGKFKDGKFLLPSQRDAQPQKGIEGYGGARFLTRKIDTERGEITILGRKGEVARKIGLPVKGLASIVFLGQDDEGNFYIQVEGTKAEGRGIDLSVYSFDSEGNLDSVIENIPNAYWVWTAKLLQVNAQGDIYQVLPTREGVEINVWIRRK